MVVIVSNADIWEYLRALDQDLLSKVKYCWRTTSLWLVLYFQAEQRIQFGWNLRAGCPSYLMQAHDNLVCHMLTASRTQMSFKYH